MVRCNGTELRESYGAQREANFCFAARRDRSPDPDYDDLVFILSRLPSARDMPNYRTGR